MLLSASTRSKGEDSEDRHKIFDYCCRDVFDATDTRAAEKAKKPMVSVHLAETIYCPQIWAIRIYFRPV